MRCTKRVKYLGMQDAPITKASCAQTGHRRYHLQCIFDTKKHLFSPSAPITLQSPIKRASKPAGRLEVVARFRGYNQGSGGNNPNAIKIHGQANNDRAFVLG